MHNDPYTLFIALDADASASGTLYLDDFHTFNYQKGVSALRKFTFSDNKLIGSNANDGAQTYTPANTIERIVLFPMAADPGITATVNGRKLEVIYDATTKVAIVRKPELKVAEDFVIQF